MRQIDSLLLPACRRPRWSRRDGRIQGVIPDADTLLTDPDALRPLLVAERARHAEVIARVEQ
jgi:hypothetical protein